MRDEKNPTRGVPADLEKCHICRNIIITIIISGIGHSPHSDYSKLLRP